MGFRLTSPGACKTAITCRFTRRSYTFDITPLLRLRPQPLRRTRFVADAQLGGLARLLRMAGFDTVHDALDDARIERLASDDQRIVLTRDCDLLKRRRISHGCYLHTESSMRSSPRSSLGSTSQAACGRSRVASNATCLC